MDSTGYITLTRQSGLMREMQVIANNIANASTAGFRQEGIVFSEFVQRVEGAPGLSMGHGNVRETMFDQGALQQTGASFDLAIEGDGFFLVETPDGTRLTRAGTFASSANGDLVTADGLRVLDPGETPVFIPPNAQSVSISPDGTISADGVLVGQVGVVRPLEPQQMVRESGVMFRADEGFEPSETSRVMQGFVEASNVNTIGQLARMIEVQRAYEMGQSFLSAEDERVRRAMDAMLKSN